MSTSGHLFLRGAPHLALVSLRGGGEERGGEKRLVEWDRTEAWRRKASQGRKSTPDRGTVVHVIGSSSYFVFLPWKEAGALSSKDAPTCIPAERAHSEWAMRAGCLAVAGDFVPAPSHLLFQWLFRRARTCYNPGYIGGTFFRKGERGGVFLVSFSMFSLCHLGSHLSLFLHQNFELPNVDHVGSTR